MLSPRQASLLVLAASSLVPYGAAYRVPIRDTDDLREVCSGMYGGKNAFIDVTFNPTSSGQVALVMYEWKDVPYLGVETPDNSVGGVARPKTYICTTSAVRSGLCSSSDLGSFITSLPADKTIEQTSLYTLPLKFDPDLFPAPVSESAPEPVAEPEGDDSDDIYEPLPTESDDQVDNGDVEVDESDDTLDVIGEAQEEAEEENEEESVGFGDTWTDTDGARKRRLKRQFAGKRRVKRQFGDLLDGITSGVKGDGNEDDSTEENGDFEEISGEFEEGSGEFEEGSGEFEEGSGEFEEGSGDFEEGDGEFEEGDGEYEEGAGDYEDEVDGEPATETDGEYEEPTSGGTYEEEPTTSDDDDTTGGGYEEEPGTDFPSTGESSQVITYTGPIGYAVPKSGYYCVGIVPVTLVNSRSDLPPNAKLFIREAAPEDAAVSLEGRQATHAEYSGLVLFRNNFEGELPAVEYPKINFYMFLSVVYFALGCGWAFLCIKHRDELLPMQYYISGTIIFLIIEMLAQFGYYRYINKHGGGATSLAFLFVISILNAARNSLSFFLLLIVSMGLSVVTQSLGPVMNRVRLLTGFHFVFGVLYSVGTVEVELDSASLVIVLILIFPLAITLTGFLMWIIISLNGTILHLQARKQRYKLAMFRRLWRILILSVIAVAVFFVVSSMSLSNRLNEDYAPNNWRYRWILLDGSLATIYLVSFASIAWLWRPTRDNVRFSTSQELAQDEADAEDYEFGTLEGGGHQPLSMQDPDEDDVDYNHHENGDVRKGLMGGAEGETVFDVGGDSDEEDEGHRGKKGYKDDGSDEEGEGASYQRQGKDD
ncbi:lung seven transmembrane receptor-domain-containing protein [Naematelia encephala]|uniref:Lung seven transmembrane receptor-domain-containing protein n=1 Tax=Naematelia encephala TaxID=71784 RepID=A0A1Y2AUA3_9TREE|nr:lung seven transmembrane receptor-domain-containing protein [Naematelia encephala]